MALLPYATWTRLQTQGLVAGITNPISWAPHAARSTDTESGRLPLCVDYIKKTTSGRDLTRKGCYRDVWAVNDTYTNQVFLVDHPSEITDAVFSSSITVTPASATAFDDAFPTYTTSTSSPATTSSSSEQSHTNTGAIVGGVIGGVAVITLVCVVVWLLLRRKKAARADDPSTMSNQPEASQPFIQPYEISPVSPGNQAKRLSQQKAQQRPNSISPVPQYSPGPYFSSSNRNSAVDLGRQGQ
ncbi:unnamed protein product [Colletotrichum noveboracense]|uniref:Uncharacterized protein n=1 Tax=Colletotrichum noveboracense TaxID=2664923 RepID=A0A9W4RWU1_9PEZI|nr:unnamed protein product [Colletotrichum noveboracense]